MSNPRPEPAPLVAFGSHPDDVEFGCGGVVALETRAGRAAHVVVCSRGESGSYGTPEERAAECRDGARALGASFELIELDGDARLEVKAAHAIRLAGVIRRLRPAIVLAPTLVENQHPDHARLGRLVRDAARVARYGGVAELRELPPHAVEHLFFFALAPGAEPRDITPILVDVSAPEVLAAWTAAMEAHTSQVKARPYVEMQLTRARTNGLRVGVGHAIALYPNDPPVVDSLARLVRSASRF
jgi:N-acetylglucosamine malate deacetylase 1